MWCVVCVGCVGRLPPNTHMQHCMMLTTSMAGTAGHSAIPGWMVTVAFAPPGCGAMFMANTATLPAVLLNGLAQISTGSPFAAVVLRTSMPACHSCAQRHQFEQRRLRYLLKNTTANGSCLMKNQMQRGMLYPLRYDRATYLSIYMFLHFGKNIHTCVWCGTKVGSQKCTACA